MSLAQLAVAAFGLNTTIDLRQLVKDYEGQFHTQFDKNSLLAGLISGSSSLPVGSAPKSNSLAPLGKRTAESNDAKEALVLLARRPVLLVQKGAVKLESPDLLEDWKVKLQAKPWAQRLNSVGRINLKNADQDWVGTGWVISENVIVTNRHVALVFAYSSGIYRKNAAGKTFIATINFREEYDIDDEDAYTHRLGKVLYIAPDEDGQPDVAFIEIQWSSPEKKQSPIPMSSTQPQSDQLVAIIGYPAQDSQRNPAPEALKRLFSDIYDVKRFQPGVILQADTFVLEHDATTLGGNSGSVVLDVETGEAVGLHFSGSFKKANYAVPISRIQQLLGKVVAHQEAL